MINNLELCQVHSLPTIASQPTRLFRKDGKLVYSYHPQDSEEKLHQYITFKQPLGRGDFYISDEGYLSYCNEFFNKGLHNKVVATTDPACGIPARPSNSFLSKYAKTNGQIAEVAVEVVSYNTYQPYADQSLEIKEPVFKLAPDNTITIRPARLATVTKSVSSFLHKGEKSEKIW